MQLIVAILIVSVLPSLGNHTTNRNGTHTVQQLAPKHSQIKSSVVPTSVQHVQAPGMAMITMEDVLHPHGASDLPDLSTVFSGVLGEVKNVASEAAVLQARLEQLEQQNEDKVANEKSLFQDRLASQQSANKDLFWTNGNLSNDIQNLTLENDALRKRIHDVQASNKEIRTEIQAISAKLSEAKDFATALLKSTDDPTTTMTTTTTTAPHVHNLRKPAFIVGRMQPGRRKFPMMSTLSKRQQAQVRGMRLRPTNHIFLQESSVSQISSLDTYADGQTDQNYQAAEDEPTSPPVPVPPVDPRQIIANLSRGLDRIKIKTKQGEDSLSRTFLAAYRAGSSVHQSLVAQQKALEETRTSLSEQHERLHAEEDDEEANHEHMQAELRGLGGFLQQVANLILKPNGDESEVEVQPAAPQK